MTNRSIRSTFLAVITTSRLLSSVSTHSFIRFTITLTFSSCAVEFRLVAVCRAKMERMDAGCPTVFDAKLLRNPLEYLHQPYTA